ncbi:response regulator transcription factor [Salinibacterium sp. G-O1]|uniref:response regulator n=1 Tax=Salinibacterium sp. G-O1 TaxID=3046208 RepID=UPI0024B8ECFE|nr:response regulator transcription factor [Salinibacterium sp. G-O1]MDJ0333817.1 response regulator transcription factor [Salinibacterium sp. G-O1]
MCERISVLVVDDQPLFASGISMIIDAQDDMECVDTASDGRDALSKAANLAPDIVMMDLRMPGLNGIDATREMLGRGTADDRPRVIALTTLRRDEVVVRAFEAGASAFLTKDATTEQVLASIRTVHAGDAIPDIAATLTLIAGVAAATSTPRQRAIEALSPREREVFLLVARGLSNTEIATAAYVSDATVKTHVGAILRKLNLRSRLQVVVFAHANDLVVL